jgi:hypothetical protein
MNYYYYLILLILPFTFSYPRHQSNEFNRFLDRYLRERSRNINEGNNANLNEEFVDRRQNMFPFPPMQQQQQQQQANLQPMCLPHIWTCGPGLPPCCPGLMCYDGNAKRGRHCVARG